MSLAPSFAYACDAQFHTKNQFRCKSRYSCGKKKKTPQIVKNKARKETKKRDPAAEKQKASSDRPGTIFLNMPVRRNFASKINLNAKHDIYYVNNRKCLKTQNKSKRKEDEYSGTKKKIQGGQISNTEESTVLLPKNLEKILIFSHMY